MIVTLTHQVEVPSIQKATALRDKAAALLEDDPDCTVVSSSHAKDTKRFKVIGVEVTSKRPFAETTEAQDPSEAKAQVESKTKIVAAVEPSGT